MKKLNVLIILGLLILLVGIVQPVYAGNPGVIWSHSGITWSSWSCSKDFDKQPLVLPIAKLNADASKYEGLLNAYSANHKQKTEERLFATLNKLSASLDEFNVVLSEVYPTLAEKEQLCVSEAYSAMALYFEGLAIRTNSLFGREVMEVIFNPDAKGTGRLWVGSMTSA